MVLEGQCLQEFREKELFNQRNNKLKVVISAINIYKSAISGTRKSEYLIIQS